MNTPSRLVKPPVSPAERAARLETPAAQSFLNSGEGNETAIVTVSQPEIAPPTVAGTYPWDGKSIQHFKQVPFRMLEDEHAMLKYFAETTYGANIQSILTAGARNEILRMATERGIKMIQDPKSGKLSVITKPRR